jgi:uncharacterized protein
MMRASLYRNTVAGFIADVDAGRVAPMVRRAAENEMQEHPPGKGEVESWKRSLPALAGVLRVPDLTQSEIMVELFMPLSSKRCDALLIGRDGAGQARAVVIELKGWTEAYPGPYEDHVFGGGRVVLHPSVQVQGYVDHLRHFHSAFVRDEDDPIELEGCAWLHEMNKASAIEFLRDRVKFPTVTQHPLFAARDLDRFREWLGKQLLPGPARPVAERIAKGRPEPSPKLLDLLVQTVENRHEWTLLDEQRTVYVAVRSAVQIARDTGEKKVIIVKGGPGTGKSVLAIQLLAHGARQHWKVVHATGSKAFQTVLQGLTLDLALPLMKRIFSQRYRSRLPVSDLFTTFAQVAKAGAKEPNCLDLMVADEAHRLWEHRRQKFPNGTVRWLSGTPMVQEVIAASKVSVFFLDDDQSVRAGEIGRSDVIETHARELGIPVERVDLNLQFRCSGSESYVNWVDGLLDFRSSNDLDWRRCGAYDFRVVQDVPSMADELRRHRDGGLKCRMVAGYCWRWSRPDSIGKLPHDLTDPRFGDWSGAWIEKTGKDLQPLDHQYYKWATQDSHAEQVGSIYSVQGFEFDVVGVIWGEDLVRRGNRWVAQLDHNKDGAFKKELRNSGGDPTEKLLNVYRVLLTRGMRGTLLAVLDEETRRYVEARMSIRELAAV